jgi:hypothetical protein
MAVDGFLFVGGLIDNAHRRFKRAVKKGEISIAALIRVFRIVYIVHIPA